MAASGVSIAKFADDSYYVVILIKVIVKNHIFCVIVFHSISLLIITIAIVADYQEALE